MTASDDFQPPPASDRPLEAVVVDDAIIAGVHIEPDAPTDRVMGVFDAEGVLVPGTPVNRRSWVRGLPTPREELDGAAHGDLGEVIYGGELHRHFGHFLLESTARLWYARDRPDLPIVWAADRLWDDGADFAPWQRELLDVLGVSNAMHFVRRPTRFARVHVPDIGYRYDDWMHPDHAAFLAAIDAPRPERGRRVWLSRTAIDTDVKNMSAWVAERHLARAGWVIFCPEQHSIRAQLGQLQRAEVIAGEEGSAFHLMVLLRDQTGRCLELIRRRGHEHRNFHTIADAAGITQRFHSLAGERILREVGREVSKISRSSAALLDALDIPIGQPAPPTQADRVAAAFVRQGPAGRVLEVGVTTPFVTAAAGGALVVSEWLEQDPRAVADHEERVVELPLARYLDRYGMDRLRFDIIRIAGRSEDEVRHAHQQSLRLARDATVLLFDDEWRGVAQSLARDAAEPFRCPAGQAWVVSASDATGG